jgi:hypothetical protein
LHEDNGQYLRLRHHPLSGVSVNCRVDAHPTPPSYTVSQPSVITLLDMQTNSGGVTTALFLREINFLAVLMIRPPPVRRSITCRRTVTWCRPSTSRRWSWWATPTKSCPSTLWSASLWPPAARSLPAPGQKRRQPRPLHPHGRAPYNPSFTTEAPRAYPTDFFFRILLVKNAFQFQPADDLFGQLA